MDLEKLVAIQNEGRSLSPVGCKATSQAAEIKIMMMMPALLGMQYVPTTELHLHRNSLTRPMVS